MEKMIDRLINEMVLCAQWRNRELEKIKKIYIVTLSEADELTKKQFLRMCIPYIYAHWEGFVVEIFKMLIGFLNELKRPRKDFCQEIQTFSLLDKFRPLSGKQSFSDCQSFNERILEMYNQQLFIDSKLFSTKSNLNYKQLKEILKWFGMINKLDMYEYDINQLVNLRNRIAHGENGIDVEYKYIEKYISILQKLFDEIILLIFEYIGEKWYLTNNDMSVQR